MKARYLFVPLCLALLGGCAVYPPAAVTYATPATVAYAMPATVGYVAPIYYVEPRPFEAP